MYISVPHWKHVYHLASEVKTEKKTENYIVIKECLAIYISIMTVPQRSDPGLSKEM